MPLAFWICAAITAISASFGFVYSLSAMRSATPDGRTVAMYAFARSVALLIVAIVAFFTASIPFEAAVAIALIIVQAVDAGIGVVLRERPRTFGPAITALVNLAALVWLLIS